MKSTSVILELEKGEYPEGECELTRSKFFGSPTMPLKLIKAKLKDSWLFLCQINMEDTESYDKGHLLPKTGMLYFFYDFSERKMHVMYSKSSVNNVIEDYNEQFDAKDFLTPFYINCDKREEIIVDEEIRFSSVDGTKLLGFPYDNISKNKVGPNDVLLLQIDPLCILDFPFLSGVDGMGYVFIDKDDLAALNFDNVKYMVERS